MTHVKLNKEVKPAQLTPFWGSVAFIGGLLLTSVSAATIATLLTIKVNTLFDAKHTTESVVIPEPSVRGLNNIAGGHTEFYGDVHIHGNLIVDGDIE